MASAAASGVLASSYYTISQNEMSFLWDLYQRESIFHMCKQLIVGKLLSNGFSFSRRSKLFEPDVAIMDSFNMHWRSFVGDAIDSILCFGFMVVHFPKDGLKRKYPKILNFRKYMLTHKDGSFELTTDANVEARLYMDFGFVPLPSGALTSVVAKTAKKIGFLEKLRETTIGMEIHKSNPHYFSEAFDVGNATAEAVDYDFFATGDAESMEVQYKRDQKSVDALREQQRVYGQHGRASGVDKLRSVIPLPTGQKLVNTPQNQGRADIVHLHKLLQEEICATIGVPRGLLISDAMYKNDVQGIRELLTQTLQTYKKNLSIVLTDIYSHIYLVSPQRVKKNTDMFKLKQRMQVIVSFDIVPFIDMSHLILMHEKGVLEDEAFDDLVMQTFCIPERYRRKRKRTEQERLISMGVKPNASHIGRLDGQDLSGKQENQNVTDSSKKRKTPKTETDESMAQKEKMMNKI